MMKKDNCDILLLADVILNRGEHLVPCCRQHSYRNMCPAHEHEHSKPRQECLPVTLAAELERPWVTFWTKAWTFPSNSNPDTPSVTSLTKPRGLPRKSTDPKMLAACHFSSYETNFVITNDSTSKSILWTYFLKKCVWTNNEILTCLRQHQQSKMWRAYRSLFLPVRTPGR